MTQIIGLFTISATLFTVGFMIVVVKFFRKLSKNKPQIPPTPRVESVRITGLPNTSALNINAPASTELIPSKRKKLFWPEALANKTSILATAAVLIFFAVVAYSLISSIFTR